MGHPPLQVALVLGTGDIASAIGWRLFTQGWGVVLLCDSAVPVLRRGIAFDDVLEGGMAELDGVMGELASTAEAVPSLLLARQGVVVANLDPAVLAACCGLPSVLIDAPMHKYAMPADSRPLAGCVTASAPASSPEATSTSRSKRCPARKAALSPTDRRRPRLARLCR
jgi:xanthine dehydrogenase accessory factor